jgi:UPF0716 protein FxsA
VASSSYVGPPRRPLRRALWAAAAVLLLVPITEIIVAVVVAHWIGAGLTVLLILAASVVGLWVLRRAGLTAARELRRLRTGTVPGREVGDAGLWFVAGALLLVPGLLTDVAGLLLLLPPVRSLVTAFLAHRLRRRFEVAARRVTVQGEVVDGVTVTSWVEDDPDSTPPRLPASGQSPGTGTDAGGADQADLTKPT